MNLYRLRGGFDNHFDAAAFASLLPKEAGAKIVPYRHDRWTYLFAVEVRRDGPTQKELKEYWKNHENFR